MDTSNKKSFHLAGIVPAAGRPLDFNFDWSDCLMPLAPNYTAIEHAVMECAWAGCETVWIVCNDDTSPLIRYRLGEYVYDPVYVGRHRFEPRAADKKKPIPIFYVPTHPNDRNRRDCLGWNILHGAETAYTISCGISKWVAPDRYYVSFPHGIYLPELLRKHRKALSDNRNVLLSYDGQSVKTGAHLGFTFGEEDFMQIKKSFRERATNLYIKGTKEVERPEDRYSGRYFSLEEVFRELPSLESATIEMPWYYDISSWENYCEYMSSAERALLTRPSKHVLSYHEFNVIGEDSENSFKKCKKTLEI